MALSWWNRNNLWRIQGLTCRTFGDCVPTCWDWNLSVVHTCPQSSLFFKSGPQKARLCLPKRCAWLPKPFPIYPPSPTSWGGAFNAAIVYTLVLWLNFWRREIWDISARFGGVGGDDWWTDWSIILYVSFTVIRQKRHVITSREKSYKVGSGERQVVQSISGNQADGWWGTVRKTGVWFSNVSLELWGWAAVPPTVFCNQLQSIFQPFHTLFVVVVDHLLFITKTRPTIENRPPPPPSTPSKNVRWIQKSRVPQH